MELRLKIVNLLAGNAGKKLTINEAAKALGEYYSFVHRTVNKLVKDGVIIKEKAGKAHLCSLNMNSEKTQALMQLGEIEKKNEFYDANKALKLILEDFVKSMQSKVNMGSIILFGSYAKGTAAKNSDIDVLVVGKAKTRIDKITKEIYAKYGKEINMVVMASNEFKRQRDKAAIREIINNHYVLHGAEKFVSLAFK